ncbi:MAG: hypothetical protein AMXMBFR77_00040 [Phycisphaerales bacterium]|nr:DUF3987 domain-containing protein [Leptolyngbya sp.]MDL1903704.1 DUF3987 domain-containing protein [Synechococcales cyanobacterium CNB]
MIPPHRPAAAALCRHAALDLAANMGWTVFPVYSPIWSDGSATPSCSCGIATCEHIGKHPRTAHGFKDATRDLDAIASWFDVSPEPNIGVPTGEANGIVVLDVDPRNAGDATLADLESRFGPIPATVEQSTGGGGRHFVFRHPGVRIGCRSGFRPGLDLKADGGYIVVAPSLHESGRRYTWAEARGPDDIALAEVPQWLLDLCLEGAPKRTGMAPEVAGSGPILAGQRNTTLTSIAGALRRCGLGHDAIRSALDAENRARCSPPLDDTEVERIAHSVSRYPPGASVGCGGALPMSAPDSWPEPKPLPSALPPVMSFDADWLPAALRPWIIDIAERVQCPIDFPAVGAMVGLAGVVGRRIGIRPKRRDDWTVVPNLWGAAIGRPGVMKTPAIQEPLKPLHRLEIAAKQEYDRKVNEHAAAQLLGKVKSKAAEQDIKKALKAHDELEARRIALESIEDDDESGPVRLRYLVNDSTVEKLGVILNQNPSGVLVYRDELVGLLRSLDREGQEGARAFYLEAWNGTGRFTFDRIGRGTIDIEAATVSIIGGIQPGPLGEYLRAAAREGRGDDGLIQRFQLAVWPDVATEWVNVDRWPDSDARTAAFRVYEGLANLEPTLLFADSDPLDPGGIPFLRFDGAAQEGFDAFRHTLEQRVRSGELHPALESHLAKYRSLVPSMALLVHLTTGQSGSVGVEALRCAVNWARYLETHAQRIYAQAVHADLGSGRALALRIISGDVKTGFALRDVYRNGWAGLSNADEAKAAAAMLADLDWLAEVREQTPGRTRTAYLINPRLSASDAAKLLHTPPSPTARTDRSPPARPSVGSVSPPPPDSGENKDEDASGGEAAE